MLALAALTAAWAGAARSIPLTGPGWTDVGGPWTTGWPAAANGSAPFPTTPAVHAPANSGSGEPAHLLAQDVFLHVYTAEEYGDFEAEYTFAWPEPFVGAGFIFKAHNASSFFWLDCPSEGIPSRDEYFPATLLTMTASGWAAGLHSEWLKGISSQCCNVPHTVRLRVVGATIAVSIDGRPLRPITIDDGGAFAQRRGAIGFASYNQEPGIDPFGTRYSNLSVTPLPSASEPAAALAPPEQGGWGGVASVPRAWQGMDPTVVYNKEGTGPVARDPASGAIVWCCAQPGVLANSTDNGRSWGQGASVKGTSIVSGASLRGKTATNNLKQLEAYVWAPNAIGDGGGIALMKSPLGANRNRVVGNVTAASLGRALCAGAAANSNPPPAKGQTAMERCLALANSSFLAGWRMGGGGTPFLEMPSGRLVMMANFGPATSISHLNGRAYWGWGPFLEGALTSSDGGESWSGPFNVDGRPSRDAIGGYGDNEDSKGGFAPMPMFSNDGRLVTIGNGGPGARNWESWSSDGGLSWSGQARGSFYTTAAASCTTASGVLIAAGRAAGGVTLHASFDDGRSWPAFHYIDVTGTWCNGDMMEVEADVVLFVYQGVDAQKAWAQNRYMHIAVDRERQWVGPATRAGAAGTAAAAAAQPVHGVREGLTVSYKSDDGGAAAAGKPHVLILLEDDGGYNGVGYMNERLFPGAPKLHTPVLDALAAEAVKLTAFYVQPLCSPTRSALYTGRYPIRLGTSAFNPDWGKPWGLDRGETFIGELMQDAGRTTGLFGKWHVGCHTNDSLPIARGFDFYEGFLTGGLTHFTHDTAVYSYPPSETFPQGCDHCVTGYDWHRFARAREGQPAVYETAFEMNGTYSSFGVSDALADFIANKSGTKPWFAVGAFQVVHEPLEVPSQFEALYPNISNREDRIYAAMTSALDAAVGVVMAAVRARGDAERTLTIFFSDNGALADSTVPSGRANGRLKGGKTLTTEGGSRVPCFWHYPAVLKNAGWHDGMFHVTDLLPTLVALAGGSTARTRPLDGHDIFGALASGGASPRRELLYNINPRPDNLDQLHSPKASIRIDNWKLSLAFYFNASKTDGQLYDLATDEEEAHDVAAANPAVVARLRARMDALAAEAVPPYQPWAPWQGMGYGCCDCNETWARSVGGAPLAWLPCPACAASAAAPRREPHGHCAQRRRRRRPWTERNAAAPPRRACSPGAARPR